MVIKTFSKLFWKSGLTTRQLAERSGVSYNTIRNWLYGDIEPTMCNLERVLDALNYELVVVEKAGEDKNGLQARVL